MRWGISILALISLGPCHAGMAAPVSRLPPLPQLNVQEFPFETQKQVQEAYDSARRHPDDAAAAGKLGMLFDLYDRPEAAVLCYQRAHQQAPQAFRWLYFWGSLLLKSKKRQEAVPILRAGLRLRPDYLPAEFKLAEALIETAQVEEAGSIYDALLKKYPQSAEAITAWAEYGPRRGTPQMPWTFTPGPASFFPPTGLRTMLWHWPIGSSARVPRRRSK